VEIAYGEHGTAHAQVQEAHGEETIHHLLILSANTVRTLHGRYVRQCKWYWYWITHQRQPRYSQDGCDRVADEKQGSMLGFGPEEALGDLVEETRHSGSVEEKFKVDADRERERNFVRSRNRTASTHLLERNPPIHLKNKWLDCDVWAGGSGAGTDNTHAKQPPAEKTGSNGGDDVDSNRRNLIGRSVLKVTRDDVDASAGTLRANDEIAIVGFELLGRPDLDGGPPQGEYVQGEGRPNVRDRLCHERGGRQE
jgi:hypothetical protein